ncbi:MAG: AzlD domain-containing protein [Ilumatobacter sp.]|nr:AzlD domain-containing protein [Ilumatobacter sp.]MDG2039127.1 AzlD domain-containing protein [Ilumatobacter sp.]
MSDALIVLVVLAAGTYVLKAAGPLALGNRRLPVRLQSLVDLLPAALLASLAIVSTVGDGPAVTLDARLVGLVFAGVALWWRAPFVIVIVVASAATAAVRVFN